MEIANEDNAAQPSIGRKWLTTFPYSKTTCVCNCGKYNLKELPQLRKILPEDYEYKLCEYLPLDREDKFLVTLRMTLSTKEEALEWKRRFEEKSLTTHVKDKTFPKVERVSVFKAQYRCQFFDRRKSRKKLPEKSKFRDCHSILFINIKKFFKNTVDRHMPTYCTVVRLHYAHDHPLDTADVLKKRQLNEDIKQRFLELFRQGMKPKDALDKHKRELLQKLGPEKYRQVVCDGYYVPNVPKAYRLYYQVHGKGVSAKTTTKRSSRHNPNPDWIAFQNCPDAVIADDGGGEGELDDDENDSENDIDDDERGAADSGGAAVEEESMGLEQPQVQTNMTCDSLLQPQISQCNIPSVRDTVVSHSMPTSHTLGPKAVTDNIVTVHGMPHQDGHIQKLGDTVMAYSNISPHNPVYTDMRNQNLPPQNMPVSSFGDAHIGMGLFNPAQPTWENFNMAHQQMMPHIPAQHGLGFQNLGHQNSQTSYMILPNASCQNTSSHYMASQSMMDHNLGLQNSIARSSDLHIVGHDADPQYSWCQSRSQQSINTPHVHSNLTDIKRGKIMPSKYISNRNQMARKSSLKKAVQKKRRASKELNMKHVTKRWMDRKPKVEAETQNLASEVLQNILLSDEAEKLKVKLLTFLSDLESKMSSNPKLFVPAVRHFLHAGESAYNDSELAAFLKDFGKTEDFVMKRLHEKRLENLQHGHTQTKISGSIVSFGSIKLNQSRGNYKIVKKSSLSPERKSKVTAENDMKKSLEIIPSNSQFPNELIQSQRICNNSVTNSSHLKLNHHTLEMGTMTLSTDDSGVHCNEENSSRINLFLRSRDVKTPSKKSPRVTKQRKIFTSDETKKRSKRKSKKEPSHAEMGNSFNQGRFLSRTHKVASGNASRKLVVKLSQVHAGCKLEGDIL